MCLAVPGRIEELLVESDVPEVFEVCDSNWRGIGTIPKSGYRLSYEYREDGRKRLPVFEGATMP